MIMQRTTKYVFARLTEQLKTLHEPAEAASMTRIIAKDGFGISNPQIERPFSDADLLRLDKMTKRLLRGEPVQYILGFTNFYGLRIAVNRKVLIPRQETEELVGWILEHQPRVGKQTLLDIGTGSGCIPLAVKKKRPHWRVEGCDHKKEILAVARKNMQENGLRMVLAQVNILNKIEWRQYGSFDVIVSNPPYIPHHEAQLMPESVKKYEPAGALFVDDKEPLIFYKSIANFAEKHLNPGGSIFFECNEFNALDLQVWLGSADWNTELRKDLNGKDRMLRVWRS